METVVRTLVIYLFLLIVMRASGKRTLSDITSFEFVLLLVVGEATQQALLGEDFSLTNAFVAILTLVGLEIALSLVELRWKGSERYLEGLPVVLVDNGELLRDRMRHARVDEQDILEAARISQGLERMDQVKYAVLEKSGGISVIPK